MGERIYPEEMDIFGTVVRRQMKEKPEAMLCFAHGGSPNGKVYNDSFGFICPHCKISQRIRRC